VKDVPVDGRQFAVRLRIRRLVCPARDCPRQTFREQIPGLLERHQRRPDQRRPHPRTQAKGLQVFAAMTTDTVAAPSAFAKALAERFAAETRLCNQTG
jgi:hypothetical protein